MRLLVVDAPALVREAVRRVVQARIEWVAGWIAASRAWPSSGPDLEGGAFVALHGAVLPRAVRRPQVVACAASPTVGH